MNNKRFLFIITTLSTLFIMLLSAISINWATTSLFLAIKEQNFYDKFYTENPDGYIQIFDKYDTDSSTIYDFFNEYDSLDKMKTMYNKLINTEVFNYLEVLNQDIEFNGIYNGPLNCIVGEDTTTLNQKLSQNRILTPLYSIQISKESSTFFNLPYYLNTGRYFLKTEYTLKSNLEIPLILGNEYLSAGYLLGDTFNFYYLGEEFTGIIVGFLKENCTIDICGQSYNLDNYIISPSLNDVGLYSNNEFLKRLYLSKTESYIYYNNVYQYNKCINTVQKFSDDLELKYYCIEKFGLLTQDERINFSIQDSKILLILSILFTIILIIITLLLFNKLILKLNKFINNKTFKIINISSVILLFLTLKIAEYLFVIFIPNNFWLQIFFIYRQNLVLGTIFIFVIYFILINTFIIYKKRRIYLCYNHYT